MRESRYKLGQEWFRADVRDGRVTVEAYRVVKITPKGAWLSDKYGGLIYRSEKARSVWSGALNAKRALAARKAAQLAHIERRMRQVESNLRAVNNELGESNAITAETRTGRRYVTSSDWSIR